MLSVYRILYASLLYIIYVSYTIDGYKFPDGFLLGFATSSYQIEGAWNEDGKGENVFDQLTHTHPELFKEGANGDIAADSYHKYKEDVAMLKNLGAQVYRFSLSWSRILPTGDVDVINQPGIDYYNNLIDELLRNGIQPMVTLFHWDLPVKLADIGGWMNPSLADYFEKYVRIAFSKFGDRVKWWITFNEPVTLCTRGYSSANITNRNGEYLCVHSMLISHARAYRLYDLEFRSSQEGKVGISLNAAWAEPATCSPLNETAAETQLQFEIGWLAHPIFHGGYPPIMREKVDGRSEVEGRLSSRLPTFNASTMTLVNGTADFLGLNHYTTVLVSDASFPDEYKSTWSQDSDVNVIRSEAWQGTLIDWLKVVPWGFRKQLNWIKNEYNNVPVFVTENGFADEGQLDDEDRIHYYREYITEMLKAIHEDNCTIIGYTAWSLMDNFEWFDGYTAKFGVYHVDFNSPNRTRTPKASANFFKKVYSSRTLSSAEK